MALRFFSFCATILVATMTVFAEDRSTVGALTYERDIRPIFKTNCFQCHGESGQRKGKLDLRLRRLSVEGGKHGAAITPGKHDTSLLFQRIRDAEMPPDKKPKLSPAQVELIGKWIDQGAPAVRQEPLTIPDGPFITEEDRNFWSFQPVKTYEPPVVQHVDRVRTPIDQFLLARLEKEHLSFSPDAAKQALIRRATFDLTGLPPTPQEAAAFVADTSPDAYERVVDRLLASPRYGERWGRHWLDLAGYADSAGYTETDVERQHAWHYRDYVINAFNNDKPFNQFIIEQLAGDELVKPPYAKGVTPADAEKLTATGFLRMAPDATAVAGVDKKLESNLIVADEIKIVASTLLGLTVNCAQCHDHRYDPIPQADYYRIRAIFEPAYDWKAWRVPQNRIVSLLTAEEHKKFDELEAKAVAILAARRTKVLAIVKEVFEKELEKLPAEVRKPYTDAYNAIALKRTREQLHLLEKYPDANVSINTLPKQAPAAFTELAKMLAEVTALRADKPVEEFVDALTEMPGKAPPPSFVFNRGDYEQPKEAVTPSELTVLCSGDEAKIPEKNPSLPTTGRRLAYARWLTSGKHPLVARVAVNRIWTEHFGRGIVATPSDFGALGERPTHPELLDWLATDFTKNGWQVKRLHKLIMTSTAYRQGSKRSPEQERIDPDNHLYGHKAIRRLDAEQFRDAMLDISGKLNTKMFGPPVPVMPDPVGQIVVGKENSNAGRPMGIIAMHGEEFRRSIYIQVRRSRPLTILATFDEPRMEPNCELRTASTVSPQSLLLMNSDFILAQATEFAVRVHKDAGDDPAAQARYAWRLAIGTEPTAEKLNVLVAFLGEQTRHFEKFPPAPPAKKPVKGKPTTTESSPPNEPPILALETLCQALWSSNAFLYVD